MLNSSLKQLKSILKLTVLSLLIGGVGGIVGSLFSHSVELATELRSQYTWLLYLLPVGGLATVGIYKLLKLKGISTNTVLESTSTEIKTPARLAPAMFISTVLTHLFGGSAGREGAALQIGGGIASLLTRDLKIDENERHILVQCGMAAVFSALFGTPLGAAVFALEVVRVGFIRLSAIMPCVLSSVTAFGISVLYDVEGESFSLSNVPDMNIIVILKVILISVCGALLSWLFCHALHKSEYYFRKYVKNDFLRIIIGGAVIVIISVLLGTTDYNGGGMQVVERIFTDGEIKTEAFVLKFIFTVITVAAGYKGGEIVPTLFIGATLGATLSGVIGLPTAFGAAVGMSSMFCGVTNCPLASILISLELFGAEGAVYFAVSCAVSFLLSGNTGLYEAQKFMFSKINATKTDNIDD